MIQLNIIEPYDRLNDDGTFDITDSQTFHNPRGVVAYMLAKHMVRFEDIATDSVNVLEYERRQHRIENSESYIMAINAAGMGANLKIPKESIKDHAKRWIFNYGSISDEFKDELEKELLDKDVNIHGDSGFGDLYNSRKNL